MIYLTNYLFDMIIQQSLTLAKLAL